MDRHAPSPEPPSPAEARQPGRVLVFGGTGTIGRATVRALLRRGHQVVCCVRPDGRQEIPDVTVRPGDVTDPGSLSREVFQGETFHAVVSCMASRTGSPRDAWAVDHQAHVNILGAAKEAGVRHFILLSAICVQKPRLAFQHAKLAFEEELRASGLTWSIVRPTAFFKSISGQVKRVKEGKPFLIFGDGRLNACKPISDRDTAEFIAGCLDDRTRWNRILPVGGPGPALTPRDQGELLFQAAGREPRFRSVPVAVLHVAVAVLGLLGRIVPSLREKAELASIGRYYATESMLVWDDEAACYDADATPEFGSDTLAEYYRRMIRGELQDDRGEHAIL